MIRDDDTIDPNATGILLCLRQLAEEAATLQLTSSLAAIKQALAVLRAESGKGPAVHMVGAPAGAYTIH